MPINQFAQGYWFKVSGYSRFEESILRLRNLNRDTPKTRQYFDWRYESSNVSHEPKVFWLMSASGEAIGMASLIFRLYWVNNQPCHLAVLGDISLDASYRGKGLGRKLLQFVSQYIDVHLSDHLGLVIPTEAAQKSLASIGWITEGTLIPYVFVLDPTDKFTKLLRSKWLAKCASRMFHDMVFRFLRKYSNNGYSIQIVREPDESFELFWKEFLKEYHVISDKGINTLVWRYVDHPQHQFFFFKFMRGKLLTGYLIYELSKENHVCSIYDVIVREQNEFACLLSLFIVHCSKYPGISTIRLLLNENHPYRKGLWKIGFFPRKPQGVFQIYLPKGYTLPSKLIWAITYGDKDI